MRKVFRFKYEPCNNTCYHYCKILFKELRQLSEVNQKDLVNLMVSAHDHLCDNPEYSFGIDLDEPTGLFVAHFRTPSKTSLYSNMNFQELVKQVCSEVLAENIPQLQGECVFGNNGQEKLSDIILKFCSDVAFNKLQSQACPCEHAH